MDAENEIIRGKEIEALNQELINLGIALTSERDLERLLEIIVSEARVFTNSDAASLYTIENGRLCFEISQNETLSKRGGESFMRDRFKSFSLPIDNTSLSGYVANTGEVVNISDAYNIPHDFPFHINRDFDKRNNYRTQSILTVPMKNRDQKIIGVLQIINAMNEAGAVIPFARQVEPIVLALSSYAAVAIENAILNQTIKNAHYQTIIRLSTAAEYRDQDTSFHIKRMSLYSAIIAKFLGFSRERVELLEYASPMHDIGKLGVPDSILLKPGPLTQDERTIMEKHTVMGANILSNPDSEILQISRLIALTHHERYDGNGYPNKTRGEDIPIEGKIVALADVFDALATKRVYKPAIRFTTVIEMIKRESGTHFDPVCVEAFGKAIPEIQKVYDEFQEPVGASYNKHD